MPGSWGHLVRRYREGFLSTPLDPAEWSWIESFLADPERSAFREQSIADQRHGYRAARVAEVILGPDRSGIRAAMLHDIGKRHARLGLVGRALASVAIRLRVPLWERARIYRDHGPVGSEELSGWGAEPLVVEFARNHHGARPPSIEKAVWEVLCETDKPH